MSSIAERRARFRDLHRDGCFAIPNPWDAGSAVLLESLGFAALATTSAGFSFTLGRRDALDALSVDDVLTGARAIVDAVDVPVSADFQAGYGADVERVAANVRRAVATGVAGLSIEDATGDDREPLFPIEVAVERVRGARAASADAVLTARAECFLYGHPDPLRESIRRLQAYAAAGADVVFAPGMRTREDIAALVSAVDPVPVNVLVSAPTGLTMADLADMGVRRVSVGSALSRVAFGAVLRAAADLAEHGSFEGLADAATFAQLNDMFSGRR